jgi:ribosome assembly protein 1
VFASATDGWAFSVATFAEIYSKKLACNAAVLQRTLWGDYYINMKEKKILRGASAKGKKPLFVQLVLENIWSVYETIVVAKDKIKLEKMISALGLSVAPRDLKTTDTKQQLTAVMSTWLPVARAVLSMVCDVLPSPADLGTERAKRLMCPQTKKFDSLPPQTQALLPYFEACSAEEDAPKIVFVSKMFPVSGEQMPERRAKPLTEEEILARREGARRRHEQQQQQQQLGTEGAVELTQQQLQEISLNREKDQQPAEEREPELEFIAFARVFSGKLRVGDEVFVLGPKYDPSVSGQALANGVFPPDCHASRAKVSGIYMLLGR